MVWAQLEASVIQYDEVKEEDVEEPSNRIRRRKMKIACVVIACFLSVVFAVGVRLGKKRKIQVQTIPHKAITPSDEPLVVLLSELKVIIGPTEDDHLVLRDPTSPQ